MSTFLDPEHIKAARKRHICDWCGEAINVGEPYARQRCFDGGDASTSRMHEECRAAAEEDTPAGEFEFEPYGNPRPAVKEAQP